MRVIAVDVGVKVCGYVVCEIKDCQIELLVEDEIKTHAQQSFPKKLSFIFEELSQVSERYKPEVLIVEKLYSHYKHPTTLGVLAQVRGIVILLVEKYNLGFYEFSPTKVRKAFLGRGSAKSSQVKKMAENIVGRRLKSLHTADAFSLVAAFSYGRRIPSWGFYFDKK